MIKFLKSLVNIAKLSNYKSLQTLNRLSFQSIIAMAGVTKTKAEVLDENPAKKLKLESDVETIVGKRTVATMCGAWRPEEEDGGMILVFQTRKECLSPDPTNESDYPENIEDFWEATLATSDNIQIRSKQYSLFLAQRIHAIFH